MWWGILNILLNKQTKNKTTFQVVKAKHIDKRQKIASRHTEMQIRGRPACLPSSLLESGGYIDIFIWGK